MTETHHEQVREMYARRASSYDTAHGGWHIELGKDFVKWLDPEPGNTVLDLACGTGLVTIPMAAKVGSKGKVVAVDLTPEMIEIGKERVKDMQVSGAAADLAPIDWVISDIASDALLEATPIKQVIESHGGFDAISLCSAMVLLPDQPKALRFWVDKLLKRNGKIILDVPTEELTLFYLMTYHLPVALGLPVDLAKGRLWIEDSQSVENLFQSVGLTIQQNIYVNSYLDNGWHNADKETGLKVVEQQITNKHSWIAQKGKLDQAKTAWPQLWARASTKMPGGGEGVHDAHPLYVCIGLKP